MKDINKIIVPSVLLSCCIGVISCMTDIVGKIENTDFCYSIKVNRDSESKAALDNDLLFSWEVGDKVGLFVDGIQFSGCFENTGNNSFSGRFKNTGETRASVNYYAVFPYTYINNKSTYEITGVLPYIQKAPYELDCDYILSDVVAAKYDETDMPDLSFNLGNHLFSILEIPITNSNVLIQQEKIVSVEIKSPGNILSGTFTYDVRHPDDNATFTSDFSPTVSVRYAKNNEPTINIGETHNVYLIVNPQVLSEIDITIKTSSKVFTAHSSESITLNRGTIYKMPAIDLGAMSEQNKKRTMVYWGDSMASESLINNIQELLGSDWTVIRGGVSGDSPWGIAGRQGGLPIKFTSSFTIPGDKNQKVETSRPESIWDSEGKVSEHGLGVAGRGFFIPESGALFNNITVNGVECIMSYQESPEKWFVQRKENGDPIEVNAGDYLWSYASSHYKKVDVMATYMGANGPWNRYEVLADIQHEMNDYAETDKSLVIGFHMGHIEFPTGSSRDYWTSEYRDLYQSEFSERYLDLKTVGSQKAKRLLVTTGVASSIYEISENDMNQIESGCWPASWSNNYLSDVHPNSYGTKALAYMVYEKMRDLGWLDY